MSLNEYVCWGRTKTTEPTGTVGCMLPESTVKLRNPPSTSALEVTSVKAASRSAAKKRAVKNALKNFTVNSKLFIIFNFIDNCSLIIDNFRPQPDGGRADHPPPVVH